MVQRLTADGMALAGEPVALLRNDQPWEAHVIESPTMEHHAGGYTLFFSANHFGWEPNQRLSPYAIGHASCNGPMGPGKSWGATTRVSAVKISRPLWVVVKFGRPRTRTFDASPPWR
jgi:hypothetical protein